MLRREDDRDEGDDVVVLVVCGCAVDVGWCWSGRRGQTCHRPCLPVQTFPQLTRHLHKRASAVVTKPSVQGLGQVGRELEWGGALGIMGNPIIQARCRAWALPPAGGLGIGWGLRLPVCSVQPRFLLGSALVCVQTDLFAVHTCVESCPGSPGFKHRGGRGKGDPGSSPELPGSRE